MMSSLISRTRSTVAHRSGLFLFEEVGQVVRDVAARRDVWRVLRSWVPNLQRKPSEYVGSLLVPSQPWKEPAKPDGFPAV